MLEHVTRKHGDFGRHKMYVGKPQLPATLVSRIFFSSDDTCIQICLEIEALTNNNKMAFLICLPVCVWRCAHQIDIPSSHETRAARGSMEQATDAASVGIVHYFQPNIAGFEGTIKSTYVIRHYMRPMIRSLR
jgi:hypothetical protein